MHIYIYIYIWLLFFVLIYEDTYIWLNTMVKRNGQTRWLDETWLSEAIERDF